MGFEEEVETICQCNPCLCDTPTGKCLCDPCFCDDPEQQTPVGHRSQSRTSLHPEDEEPLPFVEISNLGRGFTLDEFIRAKEFFMVASTNSGLSVYDHLSEVIRKLLDERNPPNIIDFMEEISLNIKRYRFGMKKEIVRDAYYISPPVLADAFLMVNSWKKHALWSIEEAEMAGEGKQVSFGGFPNLLRLLYYLEQVNVGLPREEMFRIALAIREISMSQPISRARFWGKIFGIYKNYYVLEVELKPDASVEDAWEPPPATPPDMMEMIVAMNVPDNSPNTFPGAGATFQRAGESVTDPDILTPYQETSGLPPGVMSIAVPKPLPKDENEFYGEGLIYEFEDPDVNAELTRWEQYQNELMTGFPVAPIEEITVVPSEIKGVGLNRRIFYICNELGDDWVRLPDVTPQQIIATRTIRWQLTGKLSNKLKTFPEFPGLEGNYLRALLARVTAGSQVSPRGYFKTSKYGKEYDGEDDDEDVEEEEEENVGGDDTVYPVKKFRPPSFTALLNSNVEGWVHHTSHILRQGRLTWWNPGKSAQKEFAGEDDDDEIDDEDEDDEEGGNSGKEFGPKLFASLDEDKTLDGITPWSTRASSTVFTEFQVASVRSNLWPGATAMCTIKGKVENIYFGDGLKFIGHTYAPTVPEETQTEYIPGPELKEITDPTVDEEQAWLAKLQLDEINDIEDPFVDNEEVEDEEVESDED